MEDAVIFGRGNYYRKKRESIEEKYRIIGFIDNAVKPGTIEKYEDSDIDVTSPQNLDHFPTEASIILMSVKFLQMWKQLIDMGIDEKRIVFGCLFTPEMDNFESIIHKDKMCISARGGGTKDIKR